MDRSVKAQMKYANKIGAKKTVIIGSDELEKDVYKRQLWRRNQAVGTSRTKWRDYHGLFDS